MFLGGSVFSIHPGGLRFCGVCVFDAPRGSEIFGGSVFSINPGGLSFSRGLCFQCAQGSEFFGV